MGVSRKYRPNMNPFTRTPVRVVDTAEMAVMRDELSRVHEPGTDPMDQAAVLMRAATLGGAYYKDKNGSMRRMFPKAGDRLKRSKRSR